MAHVYGLRWRIETIFKAWKSHFRLTEVPHGAAAQLEAMIYARLIFVTTFASLGTPPTRTVETRVAPPPLSLLKLAGLLGDFLLILCLEAWQGSITTTWLRQLQYHGRYERRARQHFVERLNQLA